MRLKWTLRTLFARRVGRHWAVQYRVWKSALDWTVWLYILIPGLLFAVGTYRSWWQHPPDWLVGLPDPLAAVLPLIAALSGGLRVFIEDADVLILRQRPSWMKGLTGLGIAYCMTLHMIVIAIVFGLAAVWFVHIMGLSVVQAVWWAAFTSACCSTYAIVKHLIGARWNGWRKYAVLGVAGIAMIAVHLTPSLWFLSTRSIGILQISALFALSTLAAAVILKLRARGTFAFDVLTERKAQLAGTDFLLSQSIERKPTIQLRKPLLFRRSNRIFRRRNDAGTILAEMRLKAFLRKGANVRIWLSYMSVSSTAVLMCPAWLAAPMALLLPIISIFWLNEQWKEWFAESYINQFQWGNEEARAGSSISRFWLVVPGAVWLAALAVWVIAS